MKKIITAVFLAFIFFSCEKTGNNRASSTGTGGSLARFTIVDNYLYVAGKSGVVTYDIANPVEPLYKGFTFVGFSIETIFPYQDKLFIGSSQGMFLYSLKNPEQPEKITEVSHLRACDPVVADSLHAYVTLRSGSPCGPAVAGLYSYTIGNDGSAFGESLLQMSDPYGLGIKDSIAFVCRDTGLTVVNVKDIGKPKIINTITGDHYRDVIVDDNFLVCYITTGLLLYDISNINKLKLLAAVKYP